MRHVHLPSTPVGASWPFASKPARIVALTNIPGFSRLSLFAMFTSTFTVRDSSVSTGLMNQTRPVNVSPGYASVAISAVCP